MLAPLKELINDLATTASLICTVGRNGAVSELFLDGALEKIEFSDSWATIEFSGWHIHVDLNTITSVKFHQKQSAGQSVSVFVSLNDEAGQTVMKFYFPHTTQTHRSYTEKELALFNTFRKRYENVFNSPKEPSPKTRLNSP